MADKKTGVRYARGLDWVEISGAATLSMGELEVMYQLPQERAYGLLDSLIVAGAFTAHGGAVVDPRGNYKALTVQQYDWLREQVWAAARDETLDPEA